MDPCPFCHQELKEEKVGLDDIRKVVRGFQIVQGFGEMEDKQWVRSYFQVNVRAAKKMLVLFGNWRDAVNCIQDTYERLAKVDESFRPGLEKIYSSHALEWKKNKQEKAAKFES